MSGKETASQDALMGILDLLESLKIRYWVDGGWGVDILIGRQTREHRDVDIDFDAVYEQVLLAKLQKNGYEITTDWSPARVELRHPEKGYVDVHPLQLAGDGSARQANPEGGWYHFEAAWFTSAQLEGRVIPCISAEAQKIFHSGYELREVDRTDMANLDAALCE